ncbi:hypothetical protein Pmani_004236 [Petrolisthes manimaculis]|uniref:Insertion element IS150 protein InsJ-like helix-turn-helix domain-containing protein n=1 Tax=Petrolisthes manimaculis TaxID=1843537 RepID=A0AAE1QDX1_9EUCA|nr:hypothetical protein Pmani_004236 [Petrolisthes manimaculis]
MWRKGTNIASVLFKRARIVQLWQKGMAVRNISRKTGASVTTVYRWIRRWKEEGTLKTKRYRRRPRAAAWQREVGTAASSSTVFVKPDYWEQNTELCYYSAMIFGKAYWLCLVLHIFLSNEGIAQHFGVQQIGETVKVVVKQYFAGCHLVLMTTFPDMAIVTAILR